MADKFQLKALLIAVDKITAPLRGIRGAVKQTQHSLRQLGKEGSNLMGSVGLPLTAMFGAGAFGMFHAGRMALEYADSIQNAAETTGIAVDVLQQLHGVFGLAGVGAEDANSALEKFNKGMAEAAAGKDESFANLFKKMGIPLRNAKGEIIGIEEALPILAESFKRTTNPAVRARMAVELFGKAGQKLIPALMKGSGKLLGSMKEMVRLGAVVSKGILQKNEDTGEMEYVGAIQHLDELGDQLGVLKQQGKAQITELFGSVAPSLTPAVKALQEWIAQNKDMFRLKAGAWLKNLADQFKAWIESGGIEKLASQISSVWGAFAGFVEFIGGFKNLMLGIGIAFTAGPISSIMSIIALLPKLGIAFVALGRALLAAAISNPILAAVTAIAAGALLIYQNWDKVGPFLSNIWEGIKKGALIAWDIIKAVFSWTPLGMIMANWNPIVNFFQGVFDSIMKFVQPILDAAGKVAGVLGISKGAPGEGIATFGGDADNAFDQSGGSPISQRPIIAQQNSNVQGQLKVSFENAPQGMRVDNGQTNQPGFNINPDVGYRTEFSH